MTKMQVEMRSYGSRVGPSSSVTGVLIRRGNRGFPVGPVAKTPYSQYTGLGSIPGATTKRPSIMQLSHINIKKEKKRRKREAGTQRHRKGTMG